MKWEGQEGSNNVEDARGRSGAGGFPIGKGGLSLGTLAIALVAGWVLGINPLQILGFMQQIEGGGSPTAVQVPADAASGGELDPRAQFVSVVLKDTEQVWGRLFQASGSAYKEPRLTLFSGRFPTACGQGVAAMGPFYCPGDEHVYIDLSFYDDLSQKYQAPGDFAQAYVVAHEVGHHVQKLMGTSDQVENARRQADEVQANALSVRLELQADCYAGVWAHHSQQGKGWLEAGDLEEALHAASRIGDDTLQKQATGEVRPDAFTHGSSEQRVRWFKQGYTAGDIQQCNTFDAQVKL